MPDGQGRVSGGCQGKALPPGDGHGPGAARAPAAFGHRSGGARGGIVGVSVILVGPFQLGMFCVSAVPGHLSQSPSAFPRLHGRAAGEAAARRELRDGAAAGAAGAPGEEGPFCASGESQLGTAALAASQGICPGDAISRDLVPPPGSERDPWTNHLARPPQPYIERMTRRPCPCLASTPEDGDAEAVDQIHFSGLFWV